ncbi:MAG TPA: MFS transporter [Thermomicrobiales bacterium]|nr:MFS transporter [Thermomicrobiales bacterium]
MSAGIEERDAATPAMGSTLTPWQLRSGYFWYYAAIGAFAPFIPLYYQDLGMSGLQLGVLLALPAFWTALTGALWGAIADSLAIHRMLLRIVLLVAAVVAILVSMPGRFITLLPLIAILALAIVPIPPLLDGYAVSVAERSKSSFGGLRVWGSIGFTAMVLVLGRLLGGQLTDRFLYAYALCLLLTWLSIFGLPRLAERRPRPLLDGLQAVRRSRPFLLLLFVAYLMSSGFAVINNLLSIHVRDMGGSTQMIGLVFAVASVSEFPILIFSGWLMTRIGARGMVTVALAMWVVRFAILSFVSAPWLVVGAQSLHGVTFGAFLIASVTLAHRFVGQENAATAQAALATMSWGFGSITGAIAAGSLLDVAGTYTIFRGVTVLMVVTLAVFIVGNRVISIEGNG